MQARPPGTRGREEGGAALLVMVVAVLVSAGLSFALVTVSMGRQRATEHRTRMEAALAVADAGLQRGLAEANLRRGNANWNAPSPVLTGKTLDGTTGSYLLVIDGATVNYGDTAAISNVACNARYDVGKSATSLDFAEAGRFVVLFQRGDADGVDNDADGLLDAADADDETAYVLVRSHGYVGGVSPGNPYSAVVQGQVRKSSAAFGVTSAVFLQDPTPTVALGSGNTWYLSGKDHDMSNGNPIAGKPVLPAIATNGDFPNSEQNEINNVGTNQINGTVPAWQEKVPQTYDMAAIVQWARDNAPPSNIVTGTGVNPGGPFGTPPSVGPADWQISLNDVGGSPNMVKYTGGSNPGAGIWVINGDVELAGNFNFTGIIIVTGRLYLRGGGNRTFLGAVIGGQNATLDSLDVNGNISIKYSSAAVQSATNAFATYSMQSWKKVR